MYFRNFSFSILFILLTFYVSGQNKIGILANKLDNLNQSEGFKNASISISVSDSKTGESLYKSSPHLSLIPASIMKAVTTATALELLGPDYRFQTSLTYSGKIKNDTLFGNLQIIGGGDPTPGSSYFENDRVFIDNWINAISKNGIKYISGNIILDETIYDNQIIPGSWVWDDLGNYYGAGASGINVFDNLYKIHFKSDILPNQPTKITGILPEIKDLELINEVNSSDINSDRAYVYGSPFDSKRIVRGTIPKNKSDFAIKASMPKPANVLATEIIAKLKAINVNVSGEIINGPANKIEFSEIYINQSPPLSEIIKITNYESVNLFAESLIKQIAFHKNGIGDTKEGCNILTQFWSDKGIDISGFFISDGSGLSRFNALNSEHLTGILNYMANKSNFSADFKNSLPTAGQGTLTVFAKENFKNGCLRAKSGSMTRVRSYAGYLTSDSGKQLSFSIILNNFSASQNQAVKLIENILIDLRKL